MPELRYDGQQDTQRMTREKRILVVLPTWVGDFVMATPALRAIRGRFPDADITFLMNSNLRELVEGGDWMDECIEWPPGSWGELRRTLRSRRFELAVVLPNSFRSAFIAWLSGAKQRVGYSRDGRSFLLTDPIEVRNRVPRWWELHDGSTIKMGARLPARLAPYRPTPLVDYYADLAEAIGCERPDDRLELFTTPPCEAAIRRRLGSGPGSRGPTIVISPGAKFGASKCWMPQRYAEVADRLVEARDATISVTCGPREESIARTIGSAMRKPAVVMDDPLLSLGELKSLIRRCDLWIGNDAGPRHIAKAFGVPVVTVFGPTHPDWTSTSYPNERIVRIDVDCGPCQQRICPLGHHQCMTGVTADAVFDVADALLKARTKENVAAR